MKNLKEECIALYRENHGVWSAECKQAARMHKDIAEFEIHYQYEQCLVEWCAEVGFKYFTVKRFHNFQTMLVQVSGWV